MTWKVLLLLVPVDMCKLVAFVGEVGAMDEHTCGRECGAARVGQLSPLPGVAFEPAFQVSNVKVRRTTLECERRPVPNLNVRR